MSRKLKIIVAILVPVLLLAIGGASLAFADEASSSGNTTDNATPLKGLLPRVAAILGIPEQTLTNAYKQAEKQMTEEQFLKALERAVASGRMTQEDADKLKEWYLSKPDVANMGKAPLARILAKIRGHFRGVPRGPFLPPVSDNATASGNVTGLLPRVAAILGIPVEQLTAAIRQAEQEIRSEAFLRIVDKAVEKGLITQSEANQVKEWWQQRPEAANRLLQQFQRGKPHQPRPFIKGRGFHRSGPGEQLPGTANPQGLRGIAPLGTY
ncbi:MAG: hypothetical protein HYX84_07900 [Chloroflexi bacterium]|nr:hypothetical protein [Chloroflexota bacterium]